MTTASELLGETEQQLAESGVPMSPEGGCIFVGAESGRSWLRCALSDHQFDERVLADVDGKISPGVKCDRCGQIRVIL